MYIHWSVYMWIDHSLGCSCWWFIINRLICVCSYMCLCWWVHDVCVGLCVCVGIGVGIGVGVGVGVGVWIGVCFGWNISKVCINWSKLLSVTNTLCVIMIVSVGTLIFILSTEIKLGNGAIAIVYPISYRKSACKYCWCTI